MYPYDFRPSFSGINHKEIFVVMPFNKQYDWIFNDLIKSATAKANKKLRYSRNLALKAYRTKEDIRTTSGWINVLEHLYTAQIIIGVLTSDNPNVFYELGIAHATEPIARQILIANKDYKPRFDIKDLIYFNYDKLNLVGDVESLALKIKDAIKTYKIETEKRIILSRNALGPYEFEVIMAHHNTSHFALHTSAGKKSYEEKYGVGTFEKRIEGIANLCHQGLLAFNTSSKLDQNGRTNIQFSNWWTNLGNDVLFLLQLIDKKELDSRRKALPTFW